MTRIIDPLDQRPNLDTDHRALPGATVEEMAMLFYETFRIALVALATNSDHTAAKNYMAMTFSGVKAPFDRFEVHLMRPGGKTPTEQFEAAKANASAIYDELTSARQELDAVCKANADIAVALSTRIMSGTDKLSAEQSAEQIAGLEAALVVMRDGQAKAAADGMALLVLVRELREVLSARVLGHPDEDEESQALEKIDDVVGAMGVVL